MIIIQDTREKIPWDFLEYEGCEAQVVEKLEAGDYMIKDNYDIIIDRKHSVSELAINLGKYIKRFRAELERMQKYKFRYIICEFPYDKLLMFPQGCNLPKSVVNRIRVKGIFLAKKTGILAEEFGVEFVFCANRIEAEMKAMELLQEVANV